MRIIAGKFKNHTIGSPTNSRTHPMSEQVRGAIFNTLGDIHGLTVLDAFAGSGAVGFEALSRGASKVVFIESDRSAQQQIIKNQRILSVGAKLVSASVNAWAETSNETFDIIIADPPYHDLQLGSIHSLVRHLDGNGTFVLSWPGKSDLPTFETLELVAAKSYGDAQLGYFKAI